MTDQVNNIEPTNINPIEKTTFVSSDFTTSKIDLSGLSSIEKSKTIQWILIPEMSIPLLSPALKVKEQEISIDVLDKWIKNIQEINTEIKDEITSPIYQTLETQSDPSQPSEVALLNPSIRISFSSAQKAMEKIQAANSFNEGGKTADLQNSLAASTAAMFLVGLLVVGAGAVITASAPISVTAPLSPIIPEAVSAVSSTISSTMAAELGYIGTLMTIPLFYKSSLETLLEPGEKAQKNNALNFARNIVAIARDSIFIKTNIVDKMPSAANLSPTEKTQLVPVISIALGMVALGAIYHSEAGHVTSQEMAGMLKGEIPISGDDIKGTLLTLIKTQLTLLPATERQKILEGALEYVDKAPFKRGLPEFKEIFEGIGETSAYNRVDADRA